MTDNFMMIQKNGEKKLLYKRVTEEQNFTITNDKGEKMELIYRWGTDFDIICGDDYFEEFFTTKGEVVGESKIEEFLEVDDLSDLKDSLTK